MPMPEPAWPSPRVLMSLASLWLRRHGAALRRWRSDARAARRGSGIALARRSGVAWNELFRVLSYVRSALWIVPFTAIATVLALAPLIRWLDVWLGWPFAGLGLAGAQALCETVITLSLSFMVFAFGSLLVAIQVASGQLTPRIIATTLLRDNVVRYSVGLFVFALVFSVMTLDRLDTRGFGLTVFIVALLGISCMATFLFLIDYAARLLRPVSILTRVGAEGLRVIVSIYPERVTSGPDTAPHFTVPAGSCRVVRHAGPPGIMLAVDRKALIAEAALVNGIIECVPHVGDFVAVDEPLLTLYGGAVALADAPLRETVAIGAERSRHRFQRWPVAIYLQPQGQKNLGVRASVDGVRLPTRRE